MYPSTASSVVVAFLLFLASAARSTLGASMTNRNGIESPECTTIEVSVPITTQVVIPSGCRYTISGDETLIVEQSGKLVVEGNFVINGQATCRNRGALQIADSGTISNNNLIVTDFIFENGGVLDNAKEIVNGPHGSFKIAATGALYNSDSGFIYNLGINAEGVIAGLSNGVTNHGMIQNSGNFVNHGRFQNAVDSSFKNQGTGRLENNCCIGEKTHWEFDFRNPRVGDGDAAFEWYFDNPAFCLSGDADPGS
jgi:hypothetical protein